MSLARLTTSTLQVGEWRVHLLEAGSPGLPQVLLIHGGMGDAQLHWHRVRRSGHPFMYTLLICQASIATVMP